jgi:hypothetical protein
MNSAQIGMEFFQYGGDVYDYILNLIFNFWYAWNSLSPFGSVAVMTFNISYLTTSFCYWYFLDRHDRRDLKIQKNREIPKISGKIF